jgi:hypothetical protein
MPQLELPLTFPYNTSVRYHFVPGALAQLVEQGPEEPCVPSSSLGGATKIDYKFILVQEAL